MSRLFPPGKSGGLIEAGCSASAAARCRSGFRRVNPAASLKQQARASYLKTLSEFPPGKSGGLIEARAPAPTCSVWTPGRFRRVNPAASLKLEQRGGRVNNKERVSAG